MKTIKKYANRRLYDTSLSRYITLDELAEQVRTGARVKVVDAKSGEDLTQGTLAQIILESRGGSRLLPVSVLVRMIRLGDDALSEFMGRYVAWALDVYLASRRGLQRAARYNPFAMMPYEATGAFSRFFDGQRGRWGRPWTSGEPGWPSDAAAWSRSPEGNAGGWAPPPDADDWPDDDGSWADDAASEDGQAPEASGDVAELRREVEELKDLLRASLRDDGD